MVHFSLCCSGLDAFSSKYLSPLSLQKLYHENPQRMVLIRTRKGQVEKIGSICVTKQPEIAKGEYLSREISLQSENRIIMEYYKPFIFCDMSEIVSFLYWLTPDAGARSRRLEAMYNYLYSQDSSIDFYEKCKKIYEVFFNTLVGKLQNCSLNDPLRRLMVNDDFLLSLLSEQEQDSEKTNEEILESLPNNLEDRWSTIQELIIEKYQTRMQEFPSKEVFFRKYKERIINALPERYRLQKEIDQSSDPQWIDRDSVSSEEKVCITPKEELTMIQHKIRSFLMRNTISTLMQTILQKFPGYLEGIPQIEQEALLREQNLETMTITEEKIATITAELFPFLADNFGEERRKIVTENAKRHMLEAIDQNTPFVAFLSPIVVSWLIPLLEEQGIFIKEIYEYLQQEEAEVV